MRRRQKRIQSAKELETRRRVQPAERLGTQEKQLSRKTLVEIAKAYEIGTIKRTKTLRRELENIKFLEKGIREGTYDLNKALKHLREFRIKVTPKIKNEFRELEKQAKSGKK